jgi:glycosyltransferase involved in cell wall biosynthesis
MKILFVSNDRSLFIEGSETRRRMHEYASRVDELHILSRAPFGAKEEQEANLYLHPIQGSRLSAPGQVRKLIREYGIEIVSAQDPFEHGWIAQKGIQGTSVKLHIQIHTDFLSPWFIKGGGFRSPRVRVPFINQIRRMLADKVLPNASGIRVVSERIRSSLTTRYKDRIVDPVVIPIAVPNAVPVPVPLPLHDFSFALITVSRLEPEKRIEDILYALGRIHLQYNSVGLFVVGTGSEYTHLKNLAKKLGLEKKVVFVNEWRKDAWGLMKSSHAYIQASAYEGYSRTLVEAALARLPIITTDVGIVGEVFTGYKDVLSAPVADPAALAVHIRGVVDDHQARTLLALEAERTAKAHIEAVGSVPDRFIDSLSETLLRA